MTILFSIDMAKAWYLYGICKWISKGDSHYEQTNEGVLSNDNLKLFPGGARNQMYFKYIIVITSQAIVVLIKYVKEANFVEQRQNEIGLKILEHMLIAVVPNTFCK